MKIFTPLSLAAALLLTPASMAYAQSGGSGVNVAEVQNNVSRWKVSGLQSQNTGLSDAAQRAADGVNRLRVLGVENIRSEGGFIILNARVQVNTEGVQNPGRVRMSFFLQPDKNMKRYNGIGPQRLMNQTLTANGGSPIHSFVTQDLRFGIDWKRTGDYSQTADKVKVVGMVNSIRPRSGKSLKISQLTDFVSYYRSNNDSGASKLSTMCTFAVKEGEALIAHHNAYEAATRHGRPYNRARPQSSNYDRGNEHCKASSSATTAPSSAPAASGGWGTVKPRSQQSTGTVNWDTAPSQAFTPVPGADAPLPVRMQRAFDDIGLNSVRNFKILPSSRNPNKAVIRTNFTASVNNVPSVKPIKSMSYGVAIYPVGRPEMAEILQSSIKGKFTGSTYQLNTTRAIDGPIQLAGRYVDINLPQDKSAYEFKPIVFGYDFADGSKLTLMPSKEDAKAFLRK